MYMNIYLAQLYEIYAVFDIFDGQWSKTSLLYTEPRMPLSIGSEACIQLMLCKSLHS